MELALIPGVGLGIPRRALMFLRRRLCILHRPLLEIGRMKKAIILLAGLLAFASAAIGATTRQNRADSLFFLGISPIGIHIPTLATHPVAVGIYLGESWLIGAEYGSADIKIQNKKGDPAGRRCTPRLRPAGSP